MSLASVNLEALKQKVAQAYESDSPLLTKFRLYARQLRAGIKPIRTHSANAVAFVSTDGGDNRLAFNPAMIELIRVVDSRGNECVLDALPSTIGLQELHSRVTQSQPNGIDQIKRLVGDLGVDLGGLSFLLGGLGQEGKSTGALRIFRDIVEWAVLYDLVTNPTMQWGGDTILVRDGLLRTKSFKLGIFPKLDEKLRAGCAKHKSRNVDVSLVGVAKQSAVLGKLALALELEATFDKDHPCYVEVPDDILGDCYNFERTWLDTLETSQPGEDGTYRYQSMGKMYLVKFGDRPLDPVWPVDVAIWQAGNVDKILGQLMVDAQQGFPIPDYPMCIQKAHDFAKLTGLEMEVLKDILLNGMAKALPESEVERLLRFKYLGKNLAAARYKEG